MEVVGIWDSSGTDEEVTVPDILFPLDAVKEIYKQSGQTYFASSLSFLVKDSMKLNELKQELKDAGLQTVVPGSTFSYAGAGVRVDDVIFIRSVTSLEKSLSLLQGFPALCPSCSDYGGVYRIPLAASGQTGGVRDYAGAWNEQTAVYGTVFCGTYSAGCGRRRCGSSCRVDIAVGRHGSNCACLACVFGLLYTGRVGCHVDVWKIQRCSCVVTQRLRGRYGTD